MVYKILKTAKRVVTIALVGYSNILSAINAVQYLYTKRSSDTWTGVYILNKAIRNEYKLFYVYIL